MKHTDYLSSFPFALLACYQFCINCLAYKWKIDLRMGCPAVHSSAPSSLIDTYSYLGEILSGPVTVTFTRTQCTCKHMVENKNISEKKRKNSFRTIPITSRWKSSFSKVLDFINRNLPKSYYSMTMPIVFPVVLGFALNRWESVTSFCLSNTVLLEFIIVISGYLVSFLNSQDLSSSRASYKALCFLW